ncbi:MAG: TlpA family protein disulfide reductase [Gammaproteobacteria bacterium]|nr:TlpA family protein disulfide reductase [Gammaproteobacteria bacterium]
MSTRFLIFTASLIAILAVAFFYWARLPENAVTQDSAPGATISAAEASTHEAVYPSFELQGLDGQPHDFSEWAGTHRLINFWATWCAPCRREIPLLKAFQDQHGESGMQVIGIAVDFLEPVASYAEDAQFNYPILVGEQDAMAVAESSGVSFVGLPITMIVAADGELLSSHMGEIHQDQLDVIASVFSQLDSGEIDKTTARELLGNF